MWNGFGQAADTAKPAMISMQIDGTDTVTQATFRDDRGEEPLHAPDAGLRQLLGRGRGKRPSGSSISRSWTASRPPIHPGRRRHDLGRVPGGSEVGALADKAIAQFDPKDPARSVPCAPRIRKEAASLAGGSRGRGEAPASRPHHPGPALGLTVETTVAGLKLCRARPSVCTTPPPSTPTCRCAGWGSLSWDRDRDPLLVDLRRGQRAAIARSGHSRVTPSASRTGCARRAPRGCSRWTTPPS